MSSSKILEWLETMRAAGHEDIIFYDSDASGPGRHIMHFYESLGFAQIVRFPYLTSAVQLIDHYDKNVTAHRRYAIYQQVYLIAMHDCLYRVAHLYKYVLFKRGKIAFNLLVHYYNGEK